MRNWLFRETQNFAKQPVSFAKQRNSFRIEFRETKSETSFAGNPSRDLLARGLRVRVGCFLLKNILIDSILGEYGIHFEV
jgi:hypothetical protein